MSNEVAVFGVQAESGLVEVNQHAGTFLGDSFERAAHELLAIAAGRAEEVPVGAMRMHPNQHLFVIRNIAADQREVRLGADLACVENGAEFAEFSGDASCGAAVNVAFMPQAVADQVGHRDHFEAVLRAEFPKLRHARHGAVLVHDFADDAGGVESGEPREIDRSFGLSGADQHAAIGRAQRENVAGTREVARPGARAGLPARMVRVRSAAEIPVVTPSRASMDSQKAVPKLDVLCGDIRGRRSASQRSPVSVRQIRPRPKVAMKLMISGVTFSAAMVRSPSFSRSSSSTTTSMRPARVSSIASGMDANDIS